MFKRVQFEEWQAIITTVAFFIFFTAFIYLCWRALRMNHASKQHLSRLPLEEEAQPESNSHERSQK